MQMKSIASRPFRYAGVLVQPQAEFSVKSERDAKVLVVARRAALLAAPPPPAAPASPASASKRTYKRRDMVAEPAAEPAAMKVPVADLDMRLLMHVRPAGVSPDEWTAPNNPARVAPGSLGREAGIADKPGPDQPEAAQDTPPQAQR